ncbi:DUF3833 domain-containing protein [Shewanella sp. UCD-KL12]|uniref:DUF3833 domain-containing protein n=1 Tax=Shewanella sp. UCD-KL12 TaxID=1917163 RepID=UPI002116FD03|nr:DUF3833 domain-containing protein [Shewanella sp. UCD-KL12]
MNILFKKYLLGMLALCLTACSTPSIEDYKEISPDLHLNEFFNGKLVAYGIVLDRSGKLLRRFKADIDANWQGDKGEIKEWFEFDDGERTTRIWQLTKTGDNLYIGEAGDVVGKAYGETSGSALFWQYDLQIVVDGDSLQVTLDDWMFLFDEQRLFNKTEMKKFGFKVGEVILYIEKLE